MSSVAPPPDVTAGEVVADENDPCALVLPAKMSIKEGSDIGGGMRLGKFLGAGMQARVFELVDKDGKPPNKVIKVNHADLGRKLLNNNWVWIGLEREWLIGQQLKAALQEPDGEVPGFMKVLDCLARTTGKEPTKAYFNGMVMERLNGWEVWKRIDTPEFSNIHYVREMLFQVFSALDRAQRKIGFHHADLGMRNIMEHYPKTWEEAALQGEEEEAKEASGPVDKVDAQQDEESSELSSDHLTSSTFLQSRAMARGLMPKPRAGYSCNADGSRMPLGPIIEFKIIDFGVATFNPTFAQTAGGYEYEEAMEKIEQAMTHMHLTHSGKKHMRLVGGADLPKFVPGAHMEMEMVPTQQENRFLLVKPKTAGGEMLSAVAPPTQLASQSTGKTRQAPRSAIEIMYRQFWKRKGDVYHILLSLAIVLDDRVWPKADERDVMNFISLVHHVTGVKLKARFASGSSKSIRKMLGRLYTMTMRIKTTGDKPEAQEKLGLAGSFFRKTRRMHIRLKAHLRPTNPGLLAGEALVSPFFGVGRAPHAELPVNLEAAFPRTL